MITEDKDFLLDDEDENVENTDSVNIEDDLNLDEEPEEDETSDENQEFDSVEDEESEEDFDLDSALSSELSGEAETEAPVDINGAAENAGSLSMSDIENLFKKFLNIDINTSDEMADFAPVEETIPDPMADGLENVNSQLSSDEELLGDTYGHGDMEILDSEFPDVQNKISVLKDKINTEPSYNEILEGTDEIAEENAPDMYNARTDGYDEGFVDDDSDFTRNAELSNGLEILEDEVQPLAEYSPDEVDDAEILPSVSAPTPPTTINKTVNCGGTPVQIVLTGVMVTMSELQTITESAKKHGLKLKKIHSNKKEELNIVVEKAGKNVTVNYKDISKLKNKFPFTTREGKFQSLNEAMYSIQFDAYKAKAEKENFTKLLENVEVDRNFSDIKEADILKEFAGKVKDISAWNVKSVGGLNLKTGINETYSNILSNSKEKNLLMKTQDGQHYILKGNLRERSNVGIKKDLIDLEGKKSYGKAEVVGIYENTAEGLGKIMYKTKRTSLPLLIWK